MEAGALASDDVVGAAGRKLDDGSNGDAAEKLMCEIIAAAWSGGLEDGLSDPAMTLVVNRVGALKEREAAVLRLERGLQIGGVVNGMGPRVAGEKFERVGETLGQIDGEPIVR